MRRQGAPDELARLCTVERHGHGWAVRDTATGRLLTSPWDGSPWTRPTRQEAVELAARVRNHERTCTGGISSVQSGPGGAATPRGRPVAGGLSRPTRART